MKLWRVDYKATLEYDRFKYRVTDDYAVIGAVLPEEALKLFWEYVKIRHGAGSTYEVVGVRLDSMPQFVVIP